MREYSKRLGRLHDDQLQAALDRFDLGKLVSADPVRLGNFGQNVFLTSTAGEWVLRGNPLSPEQFVRERFFTDLLHEHTDAPVPWPYRLETDAEIFGWSFALMPRLPGLVLADDSVRRGLDAASLRAVARALGKTLVELQRLTWPVCGECDAASGEVVPLDGGTHADWIAAGIREALDRAPNLTDADRAWAFDLVAEADGALRGPFTPTFVHRDYHDLNVLASCVDGEWQISGVLDYQGYFGDPERDLVRCCARYVDNEGALALAREFVRSWAEETPPRPGYAQRFAVYILLDRALIWSFGHGRGVWWDPDLSFREWIEPFTALEVF